MDDLNSFLLFILSLLFTAVFFAMFYLSKREEFFRSKIKEMLEMNAKMKAQTAELIQMSENNSNIGPELKYILQHAVPNPITKANLISSIPTEDRIYHLSAVAETNIRVSNNKLTLVISDKDENVKFYDSENNLIFSTNNQFDNINKWLNLTDLQPTS